MARRLLMGRRMNRFIIASSLLLCACGGVEGELEVETVDLGLIGGSAAQPGQWDATLYLGSGCTAARVSTRSILTAAHCVLLRSGDTIYPMVRYGYWAGNTIQFTNSKTLDGSAVWHTRTVRRVYVHPRFLEACDPHCHQDVSLQEPHAPDVALIVLEEELPSTIPAAYISTNVVQTGDPLTIMGYGCERSVWLSDSNTHRLKYEVTAARNTDHFDLKQGYIHSYGLEDASSEASICPGDSGGPVYRGTSEARIVGVNAFYLFDDRDSGISSTNLHTRLGSGNPHHVEDWLRSLLPASRFVD
jgi:hypothetical protein